MIGRDRLITAEPVTVLRAVPEAETVKRGHLAFIRLQLTDKMGEVKPTERSLIRVSVKGGKLRALGSACPYYERSYLDSECDTYYGEALAIVEVEDDVTLTAESKYGSCEATVHAG